MAEQEATYQLSLALVAAIDNNLSSAACHYRSRCGILLRTLDEVVRAILADDLTIGEPTKVGEMTAETQERIRQVINSQTNRRNRKRRAARKSPELMKRIARNKVRRCKDCQAELVLSTAEGLFPANITRPRAQICRDCTEARTRKENYRRQSRWLTVSQRKELALYVVPPRVISHWRNEWGWTEEQIRQACLSYVQVSNGIPAQ